MKDHKKLTSQQETTEHQQALTHGEAQQRNALEFQSVEQMLRHDCLHTPVPPIIAQRLQESVAQLPPPPRSWWRRFFGGQAQ